MEVDVARPQAKTVAEFRDGLAQLSDRLCHEIGHLGQQCLGQLRGLDGKAGLPARRMRMSPDDLPRDPLDTDRPAHALRDEEFYPRLRDEVADFRRALVRVPRGRRCDLFRFWVGVGAGRGSMFFAELRAAQPRKWRRAVGLLYKEIDGDMGFDGV